MGKHINIFYGADNNYAPYMRISIYSLLVNSSEDNIYTIYIFHTDISEDNQRKIQALADLRKQTRIMFVDANFRNEKLDYKPDSYITAASNLRLLLLCEEFDLPDRIVYLDCDTIIEDDISKLFETDLKGFCVGGVEETGFRLFQKTKKGFFIDGRLLNIDLYKSIGLGMKSPTTYFNAGVFVLDVKKARELHSYEEVLSVMRAKKYFYRDQDILNILFDGEVLLLDNRWNYQNNIDYFLESNPEIFGPYYSELKRESPGIIHFISSQKPWNAEVALSDVYRKYERQLPAF